MDVINADFDKELYIDDTFCIRLMTPTDIEEVFYNLIDKEPWDMPLSKIKTLHEIFPESIYGMVNKKTKEIIGTLTIIPTHPGQYVLGYFVIRKDYRKQGHGLSMMNAVVEKFSKDRLTLVAVPGTEYIYRKFGFLEVGPIHHVYYFKVNREMVEKACCDRPMNDDVCITLYTSAMFPALNEYDTNARGYDCGKYVTAMTKISNQFLVAKSQTSNQIVGYASGVDVADFLWIDGMYADSDDIALQIFGKMLESFPHKEKFRIETIKPREFLIQYGDLLPKTFVYPRMARGSVPVVPLSKLYAVADCGYTA